MAASSELLSACTSPLLSAHLYIESGASPTCASPQLPGRTSHSPVSAARIMEKAESDQSTRKPRGRPKAPHRRGSREDLDVSVVFPGLVTRESCCRFTCELLKHILHQRHQLPLPYEELLRTHQRQQEGEVIRKPIKEVSDSRQCQRSLSALEELLVQLETLFTLTAVPQVLLLLGGTAMVPKEMYLIDMEGVQMGNGEESLSTRPCLRQLFHALFLADPFSDLRSTSPMNVSIMVQGHRDCGTEWFRPKLNYKVPIRGHTLTIRMSCSSSQTPTTAYSNEEYIWFQAPITLKGFHY
ncbi:PREDICTED: MAD2L1-binding protein [Nanorana parkeri]|uniref:MAD2L1-binding protein n=1 Tax=Nanorana parkeri TaxID=125878 RepID=UPI0008545E8D|nr:PREDICTED: MAD2L1-binding protein [Nanorana parkeri]